jgi:hypothetical protein
MKNGLGFGDIYINFLLQGEKLQVFFSKDGYGHKESLWKQ